ncbi:MAG: patatin-like phospholipase family protein [Rhodothermaceae bacterium]|nr:patatin-like phospholipase family protein [Rhodothermaceae bacterium]
MSHDAVAARHAVDDNPKRMLALDGGGIKGILTLGYLKRIETLLRLRYNKDDLVLSDYYDFIGGTSTGAIIAASLSLGNDVDTIIELYEQLGKSIFETSWRRGILLPRFKTNALEAALKDHIGDISFADEAIKTGLMIILKRWDTGSLWVLHNIRGNKYYEKYTKGYLLRQVVRGSTAAPSYFKPEVMDVTPTEEAAFVDGGVTSHNNPAWQLFMLATINGYGLNWSTGADNLSITSIGTGFREKKSQANDWKNRVSLTNALTSLQLMMDDADSLNQIMLQWLSKSPTNKVIDSEIGDLAGECLTPEPLFHYVRYDIELSPMSIRKAWPDVGTDLPNDLHKMEKAANIELLKTIGEKAAAFQLTDQAFGEHFPKSFDIGQ